MKLNNRSGVYPALPTTKKCCYEGRAGFTMLELLMAILVLVVALVGLLSSYTGCFNLNETARNLTVATNAAQQKMEEIRNTPFDSISGSFNNVAFNIPSNASPNSWLLTKDYAAKTYVSAVQVNQLLQATVVVCWRQRAGRIIGEAVDSGGNLGQSDINGNGTVDSPCSLVTYIARR